MTSTDLPDWIAIAVAIAAFGVALTTLWIQLIDRRRADAAALDVYFERNAEGRGVAVVHNSGSRSIYDIRVQLRQTGGVAPLETSRVFRLAPNARVQFRPETPVAQPELLGPELLGLRADFSDWAGRRWRRTNDGRLRRARFWNRLKAT